MFHDLYGSYESYKSCQAIHGSYPFDSIGQGCHEESKHDEEQESEYDTESESDLLPTVHRDQEDEMTFIRAVTTRSGRTVRIASKLFELTGTVVLRAVKIVDA